MNSCILMAEIVDAPQLRFTPDQLKITEMLVSIPGLRPNDPPAQLKTIAFGELGQSIHDEYQLGDRLILEGRLGMKLVERSGFKEKQAELVIQKVYRASGEETTHPGTELENMGGGTTHPNNVVPLDSSRSRSHKSPSYTPPTESAHQHPTASEDSDNTEYDPIPF